MGEIVTVGVATYNSELFVVETLESIYKQNYDSIELIISDDCSKDNTIQLVRTWVDKLENPQRFKSVSILTVERNTGVSSNCNRIIKASTSNWIKFIAGDDILLPNCLKDNMEFVEKNKEAQIIFSQVALYKDVFQNDNFVTYSPDRFPDNIMGDNFDANSQYKKLLVADRLNYTPSYFFKKSAIVNIGMYDENNRLVEDYPMWLKLTKSGEKLHYFHKLTVGYRVHLKASNNVGGDRLFPPSAIAGFPVRKTYAFPELPWEMVGFEVFVYWITSLFNSLGIISKTKVTVVLYRILVFYLNPFHYIFAFKKRLPKNKTNDFYN